mgnify:CR=1 FL=1
MRLILASQSPRRREMLALMGYAYEIVVSDADEHVPPCAPAEFVERLALRKAEAVFASYGDCCVVGADTIVYLDGSIIGKPADASDAFRILRTLSGRTHTVYTGVAVLSGTRRIVFHDAAEVTFAPLSDEEIHAYIATGEPLDKAGREPQLAPARCLWNASRAVISPSSACRTRSFTVRCAPSAYCRSGWRRSLSSLLLAQM